MKNLLIFLIVGFTLTLSLTGCGYSEADLTEAYNEGYSQGWADCQGTPEGSIIYKGISYHENRSANVTRVDIYLTVENVGGDGAITVYAEFQQSGHEPQTQSKKIYLKQGENQGLNFSFYLKPWDADFTERAWCEP